MRSFLKHLRTSFKHSTGRNLVRRGRLVPFPIVLFPEPHLYGGFLCLFTRDVDDPRLVVRRHLCSTRNRGTSLEQTVAPAELCIFPAVDHKFFERLDEFLFVFLDVLGKLLLFEILCLYAFGFLVDG